MTKQVRKSLELTPAQWETLQDIAKEFGLAPNIGPTPKQPSWRVLIRQISNGNIVLSRKDHDHE